MAGRLTGVQARLLEKCDKAIYVHFCAHSLNLAIQDATRAVLLIRDVLDDARELNIVFRLWCRSFPQKHARRLSTEQFACARKFRAGELSSAVHSSSTIEFDY